MGPRRIRWCRIVAALVLTAIALPALLPMSLWIVVAESRVGRWWGGLSLFAILLVVAGWLAVFGRPVSARIGFGLGLIGLVVLGFLHPRSVPEPPPRSSGLISRFVGPARWRTIGPFGSVPERDLVALGGQVLSRLAFWIRREEARRIREVPLALYAEIDADDDRRALRSATGFAVAEILGLPFDSGHYYAYIPEKKTPDERLGALIFLHGNGGNFKLMPWALRALAERHRLAILAPTFGYGLWGTGAIEAIDRVWEDARNTFSLDRDRVFLAGLSDGGKGVTRQGRAHPELFRGLLYLSPTIIASELSDPDFARSWRGRPIFVATGGRDWNVRPATVERGVDLLRKSGAQVDYALYPDEDHFLFLGRRRELLDQISKWMDGVSPVRPGDLPTPETDR